MNLIISFCADWPLNTSSFISFCSAMDGKHCGTQPRTKILKDSVHIEAFLSDYFTRHRNDMLLNGSQELADVVSNLPLTRVKRIMKMDACEERPRMIAANVLPIMAVAVQLFIGSVTTLAWQESRSSRKRKTLQACDIVAAVQASSRFDFLCDVVSDFQASQQHDVQIAQKPVLEPRSASILNNPHSDVAPGCAWPGDKPDGMPASGRAAAVAYTLMSSHAA